MTAERRAWDAEPWRKDDPKLQWSRGSVTAERKAGLGIVRYHRVKASMEPRFGDRGTRSTVRAMRRRPRHGFNGAAVR